MTSPQIDILPPGRLVVTARCECGSEGSYYVGNIINIHDASCGCIPSTPGYAGGIPYTFVLEAVGTGLAKIECRPNFVARALEIAPSCPTLLRFRVIAVGDFERTLHSLYASWHSHNDWFFLDEAAFAQINRQFGTTDPLAVLTQMGQTT